MKKRKVQEESYDEDKNKQGFGEDLE